MKFSEREITDLLKAWVAITIAFSILLNRDIFSPTFTKTLLISAFTVGTAFLLHELGHKYVAQRYKYWAEFRAFNFMLILAIFMSFLGFIFIAPGAVMIHGYYMSKEKNGKISMAGPLVNLILALFFIILLAFGIKNMLTHYGAMINAWIALFNMIPFGNIDGRKILNWNRNIYLSMLASGFILLILQGVF
jgi:Zn-dependent protease